MSKHVKNLCHGHDKLYSLYNANQATFAENESRAVNMKRFSCSGNIEVTVFLWLNSVQQTPSHPCTFFIGFSHEKNCGQYQSVLVFLQVYQFMLTLSFLPPILDIRNFYSTIIDKATYANTLIKYCSCKWSGGTYNT